MVTAPPEIRSLNGTLRVSLSLRSASGAGGETRYCYVDEHGNLNPTLRLKPGDLLVLKLKNDLSSVPGTMNRRDPPKRDPCASWKMQIASTNLHFHGLMVPPVCHQDDVLNTTLLPQSPAYEYRVRIPANQPPGLYWYHPHPHGHSEEQVLGGASGALIIEGVERFNASVVGLPERLLIFRDQARANAAPVDGRKAPSKDLSVNFVPVPFPDYEPAIIKIKPLQRELWRVLNASADTFVDVHLLTNGRWQNLGLVSVDGVPLRYEQNESKASADGDSTEWVPNVLIPPGGRAEFLYDSPAEGGWTQLLAAGVDTVPVQDEDTPGFVALPGFTPADDDDYTPPRWMVKITARADAPLPASVLPKTVSSVRALLAPLASVYPTRTRKLYFSEKVMDAKNPRGSTVFYLTEEGHVPTAFDPSAAPNITVRQGEVEDWIIENRSQEVHTFHIHQTHFVLLERDKEAVKENYLRDSVDVPYWDGLSKQYPSVKLRIDFRGAAVVGTFPYHCHILQHEDGGMMGTIQVLAAGEKRSK